MRSIHDPARHSILSWRLACTTLGSAAAMLAGAWASGCSLIYDLSTAQCSTTSDCTARGGAFAELVCTDNLCQPAPLECETNAACLDRVGQVGEAACIENVCVNLTSNECPVVLPRIDGIGIESLRSDDDTLILGAFSIFDPGSYNSDYLRNYELALAEVKRTYDGIPSNAGGNRQVVMVVCDSQPDTRADLDASMTHLVSTLRVPGIVAALAADDLQYAIDGYPSTFFMSPLESDPTLVSMATGGRVWFVGPGPDTIGQAYAPLLKRTLAHLALPPTERARVATIEASDERFMSTMLSTVQNGPEQYGIFYNEQTLAQNSTSGDYLPLAVTSSQTSFTDQIDSLLEFKPHVIIAATGPNFFTGIVPALEENWDDSSGQPPPFYLLSPFVYNSVRLNELIAARPEVRTRLAGVNGPAAEDQSVYSRYVIAWDTEFAADGRQGVRGYENYYDAAYYLIYAAAGAAKGAPTTDGDGLSRGMRLLLGGRNEYNVGDDDIPDAMLALRAGTEITLNGTLGPPDFDENTGAREAPGSVWCMDSTPSAGATTTLRSDVLRYQAGPGGDPTLATLEGNFPPACIPDF
jgi:hypothetical protein